MDNQRPGFEPNATLCERCAAIDFEALLAEPCDGPVLGRVAQYTKGNCTLCDFFFDLLPDIAKQGDQSFYSYCLRSKWMSGVILGRQNLLGNRRGDDGIMLQLDPIPRAMEEVTKRTGLPGILIVSSQDTRFPPLKDQIDFQVPKQWLDQCLANHDQCCWPSNTVEKLKLIDCHTRKIVPSDDFEYVTLSYVWGSESQDSARSSASTLSNSLPQTIEDAITVTKALGYRYIWVDKYCINQSNAEESLEQIRQMDVIYRNSALTIIDAAGKDPYHGLPGVRPRSRSSCHSTRVYGFELVSTPHRPEWYIETSRWNTRGWTYQEGLLSRRRLVFTSQQLYFECQTVYSKEVGGHLSRYLYTSGPFRKGGFRGLFLFNTIEQYPETTIIKCLQQYSRRSLTKESDILNGVLGLFKHAERLEKPVLHIWGVPLLIYLPQSPETGSSFVLRLCWNLKRPSPRRRGFPSFSWAGWYGEVEWLEGGVAYWDASFKVSVETTSGEWLSVEPFQELYSTLALGSRSLKPVIHIQAYTAVAFRRNPEYDLDIFRPTFMFYSISTPKQSSSEQVKHMAFRATTTEVLSQDESYLAIFLAEQNQDGFILIVIDRGDVWERVAIDKGKLSPELKSVWREVTLG